MTEISRRSAVSSLALAATTALGQERATAFALIGDRYHNSDYIRTALSKTLSKGLGLEIDFRDEVSLLNARELKGRKLLIILRDGMLWPDGYPQAGLGGRRLSASRPFLNQILSPYIGSPQSKAGQSGTL
jgi:hypothetical protein